MNLDLLRSRRRSLRRSKAQLGVGKQQAAKLNRNALSACGDSARDTAASQAHDRELNTQELSSLCTAAKAIANEVVGIEAHSVVSRWLVLGLSVVASVIFLGDPGSWT